MKLACLLLLLLSASIVKADSITAPLTDVQLSGIGSGQNATQFWSSDPSPHLFYNMMYSTTQNNGFFSVEERIGLYMSGSIQSAVLANGVFTADFIGREIERLGPNDWGYWIVTGILTETVDFHKADGVGSIKVTSVLSEGQYANTPEPGTWLMLLTGAIPLWRKWRRA